MQMACPLRPEQPGTESSIKFTRIKATRPLRSPESRIRPAARAGTKNQESAGARGGRAKHVVSRYFYSSTSYFVLVTRLTARVCAPSVTSTGPCQVYKSLA